MGGTGDAELWATRPRQAGALSFFVTTATAEMQQLVEQLFQDLPTAEASGQAVEGFLLLRDNANPGRWQLMGPEVGALAGLTDADALAGLVTAVNLAALRAEPERLHLHAGAVVREGRAIVMSAPRETGKTTTVARLVLRGWSYISDEAVSISSHDTVVRGFPKPLSIKPEGRTWVTELRPHLLPPITEVAAHEIVHAPLGASGATVLPAAEPTLVLLLRREPEQDADAEALSLPVHPVDAVVHLMSETMDAARFGEGAVEALARLAVRCACHEVLVGDPEGTAKLVEELSEAAPPPLLPLRSMRGGVHVKENVASVMIGDRVVIHQQPDGVILALDSTATQVWSVLGGWEENGEIDLRGPVVAPFVDQLVELGLVEPWWSDT